MIATATETLPAAEVWEGVTDTDYFGDSANSLSNSECKVFSESPRLYYGRFIARIPEYQQKTTKALDVGHFFEDTLYPPPAGSPLVIPREVLSKSGSKAGGAWDQFEAENAGRHLVKQEEKHEIDMMIDSVHRHTWARKLLIEMNGKRQVAIRFTCPITGIRRRCKLDHKFKSAIVDLKTCRDASAEACSRDALEFSYHRQCDWYRTAVHALTGEWLPFLFVFVQKTAPYTVRVFELNQRDAELGALENIDALKRFALCQETGIWEEDGHGEIQELSLPPWKKNRELYALT
jgi:hypothetical protein